MHYPDLSPFCYFGLLDSKQLVAVGWLEPGHDFSRGEVSEEFVSKLTELLANPWQPVVSMGRHQCGFCRLTGGPIGFRNRNGLGNREVSMGVSNLWVPANGFLFVVPSLILHYMDAHEYCPPSEFQIAVMSTPTMRSIDYLKAILKNGPKEIVLASSKEKHG